MPAPDATPLLTIRNARKRFGSTLALDGVNLTVRAGEIHALIGENGAGKSTLMNVLCGIVEPDEGEMLLGGLPYRPRRPADAAGRGIAMIHQELTLAPHLSVEANILLGIERARAGFLSRRRNIARAREVLQRLQRADMDLDAPVRSLGIGERQLVEIARALALDAKVLIMDEPTSSLSAPDKARLFAVMRELRDQGIAIIYISHFLEEVAEVCDRYTVLRDGSVRGVGSVDATTRSELIEMMVGRKIEEVVARARRRPGAPVLAVRSLSGRKAPVGLSLELRRGEILGMAGLIGAGRTESLRLIFGLDPLIQGELGIVEIGGREKRLGRDTPRRVRQGLGMVSEDRKGEGLALGLSVAENLALSSLRSVSRLGWLSRSRLAAAAEHWIGELRIRTPSPAVAVASLSGGNQQKVAVARLLQMQAEVFLLDEPTRGIDLPSKLEIYRLMDALAASGKAILFVSSYLAELLAICDRIAVMSRGRLVALREADHWTEHTILEAATGGIEEN